LKLEVAELMAKAEAADKADVPGGMSIPDEVARRAERLKKIVDPKACSQFVIDGAKALSNAIRKTFGPAPADSTRPGSQSPQ
jgi:hypothetical protein